MKPAWSDLPTLPPTAEFARTAEFSACGLYRYTLDRSWDAEQRPFRVLYIGLNPSTADERTDDRTTTKNLKRLAHFCKGGMGQYRAANAFAYCSPTIDVLAGTEDPIGPDNDMWLIRSIQWANVIFAGWGNGVLLRGRDRVIMAMLRDAPCPMYCLGLTKLGEPRHPCRLGYDEQFYVLQEDEGYWYETGLPRRLFRYPGDGRRPGVHHLGGRCDVYSDAVSVLAPPPSERGEE